jgi:ADP-heptose:LPS heptosyltransferase
MLLCALIATTSLPEKKQFGVSRFLQVATALQHRWREYHVHIVLVLSPSMVELDEGPSTDTILSGCKDSPVTICCNGRLEELGYLFARTTLAIGNDTGLTHLAGLSQMPPPNSPPQVIQLYSRHDYTRWTTGRRNVHPLFTAFSRHLRDNDLATITDRVNDEQWGPSARATAINATEVVALAHSLLTRRVFGAGDSKSGTQVF